MGSQAVVGRAFGTEPDSAFRGRYVHYTGDPLGVGPELVAMLAARDGSVERLLKTLIIDHYGWSELSHEQTGEVPRSGSPVYAVEGVGLAYSDAKSTEWIGGTFGSGSTGMLFLGDWAYLFNETKHEEKLVVARMGYSRVTVLEQLPVQYLHLMTLRDWKQIEQKGHDL